MDTSFEHGCVMCTAGADVAAVVHEEVHKLIQNSLHAPGVAALPMTSQMIRDYKVSRAMNRGFRMLQVYRLKGDEDVQQLRKSLDILTDIHPMLRCTYSSTLQFSICERADYELDEVTLLAAERANN